MNKGTYTYGRDLTPDEALHEMTPCTMLTEWEGEPGHTMYWNFETTDNQNGDLWHVEQLDGQIINSTTYKVVSGKVVKD